MALVSTAIRSARVYLNDINGITWTDSILIPLLQEAHGELQQALDLNSAGVINAVTDPIIISAGTIDMGADLPINILTPISILEGDIGVDANRMQGMIKVTFLPSIDPNPALNYWAWMGDKVEFLGATSDRQVIMRYKGSIVTPSKMTDNLGCIFAERFLGPRVAALAFASCSKDNKRIQEIADLNLFKLISAQVKNDQRPVRRRGYQDRRRFGFRDVSVPIGNNFGGTPLVTWISTSTPPDGARTIFIFPYIPKYISFNGLNQFQNLGYTLAVVAGHYTVTFHDIDGNVITPEIGDDIREAI